MTNHYVMGKARSVEDEADVIQRLVENDFRKEEKEKRRITEEDRIDHCAGDGE